MIWQ